MNNDHLDKLFAQPDASQPDLIYDTQQLLKARKIAEEDEENKKEKYVQPPSKRVLKYETYHDKFWIHHTKTATRTGDVNDAPVNSCEVSREDADETPGGKLMSIHTCRKHYLIVEWKS